MSSASPTVSVSPNQRSQCPNCREWIDSGARVCPHCQREATLDVMLSSPILDPRLRYQLACSLVGGSETSVGAWVKRLARGGVILRGAQVGQAEAVVTTLVAAGQDAIVRPHQPRIGKVAFKALVGAAGLIVLALTVSVFVSTTKSATLVNGPLPNGLSPREIAAKILPSVVVLRCADRTGSGFFVTEHRLLTNEHVTCGATHELQVELAGGLKGQARVLAADERLDLAVLETELTGVALRTASAGTLASGDSVMVAGAPMGLERTFHVGTVSNARRVMIDVSYIQIDARINPGNSGGPVLDTAGQVVGVVSLKRQHAEGIGFALPIDYAFDGEKPLLPPPRWYPSDGFKAMLAEVKADNDRLIEESKQLGMRIIRAVPSGSHRIAAALVTAATAPPAQLLGFRLEQRGFTICSMSAAVSWQENNPESGMAKKASEWAGRIGLGRIYSGIAELDVRPCKLDPKEPIEVILQYGDEKVNRVTL